MRTVFTACVALVALSLLGCTGSSPGDGPLGVSRSPIAYGSLDTTHTAVVAVLAPAGGSELEECTGTIVQVSGTVGYVLTAAHCCNMYVPTVVVISSDYSGSEQYALADAGAPKAPAYPVVPGSVQFDPMYSTSNELNHDFCMLKFSGATASTPTIALPTSTNDGLAVGSQVEHVGFGVTQKGANSSRMTGTDTVTVLPPTPPVTLQFAQGGDADIPGGEPGADGHSRVRVIRDRDLGRGSTQGTCCRRRAKTSQSSRREAMKCIEP
jgi:hypothetical protein